MAPCMPSLDLSLIRPRPDRHRLRSSSPVPEHTAPRIGSGRIAVLATPVMINVIEAAALAAVEHLLPGGASEPRHPSRRAPLCGDAGGVAGDGKRLRSRASRGARITFPGRGSR